MAFTDTCPDPCCNGPDADERVIVCYGPEEPMEESVVPDPHRVEPIEEPVATNPPQADYTAVAASIADIFQQKMECCQCEKFAEVRGDVSDIGTDEKEDEEVPLASAAGNLRRKAQRSAKGVSMSVESHLRTMWS